MFVEEYLLDLARSLLARRLDPYARCLARRVREDFVANPEAVRSVWSVALVFFAFAFLAAAAMALAYDRPIAYDFFLQTSLWILPTFTLVTLHIGLLRDRDGYRLPALDLPTVLTLFRITLVPAIRCPRWSGTSAGAGWPPT